MTILSAKRIPPRSLPRPKTAIARSGLSYQRAFTKAFSTAAVPEGLQVETNAWFEYHDSRSAGPLICSPDLLIFDLDNDYYVVIEVKLNWTPLAIEKLRRVYCPVISKALDAPVRPLVAAKILSPSSPRPQPTLTFALIAEEPLIHWTGMGPILW